MEILALYYFEIQHRLGKKMVHANYLSRLYQEQMEYLQDRKDAKFVLNILYTKEEVYKSKRYKDLIEGLIQVPSEKTEKGETSYQAVCRETKEETGLHMVPKYLTKNDRFNYDIYITDITERETSQ